ncbi:MAG: hypothetical protein Q9M13_04275, partial [Mariprofundales bacterium]|nr:hypothetical protein [Mariprofundales bacterium]
CVLRTDGGGTKIAVNRPNSWQMVTDSFIVPTPMAHIAVMIDTTLPTEAERLLIIFNGQVLPWSAGGATSNNILSSTTSLQLIGAIAPAALALIDSFMIIDGVTPDYAAIGSAPTRIITNGQYPGMLAAWNFNQSLADVVGTADVVHPAPAYIRMPQ